MPIEIDQLVPSFSASSTAGELSSEQLRGKIAVLYFYPKDNTPGCTLESQGFRDLYARFEEAGAAVIGISRDSLTSHERFRTKCALPFPLIADSDEQLCLMFDVMKMKNMYGKQVRGIERSTFVIDAQGIVKHIWRGVKVPGHAEAVLAAVVQTAQH